MRYLSLVLAGAALASCSTAPQPGRTAQAEQKYQQLLAGKTAGQPVDCLPSYRSDDMVIIDDSTVAFRDGSSRTYVNHLQGNCSNIGTGHYALVTKSRGSSGLCRGDIAQVADLSTGTTVGSCVIGEFVPYRRTGG